MKFCLGTAQFGYPYGLNKSYYSNIDRKFKKIIQWNQQNNFFNYLDTAFKYGDAEKIIGKTINKKNKIKIISKFSYDKTLINFDEIVNNFHQSLKNLKTNSLYGVLVHDNSMFNKKKINTTIRFLEYIKKNKLSKKIGISVYDKYELKKNLKYFKFDIIQLPLNIFNQSFAIDNYLDEISKEYEIFVRSIFLQGLLLDVNANPDKYFNKYKNDFIKYSNFLTKYNLSPLEACLYYIFSLNLNLKIIFGVNDLSNIKEIYKTVKNYDKKTIKEINFSLLHNKKTKLINPSFWNLK